MPSGILTECPETLRSEGVAPKPAPVRRRAWATFKRLGHGRAFVEVTYLGAPDLFSMSRVEVGTTRLTARGTDPLAEACYQRAEGAAAVHGFELDRFSEEAS
jgi:hypothetical protein